MSSTLFYNLHVDDFVAKPLSFFIARRRALKKFGFLIDLTDDKQKKLNVLVDFQYSSILGATTFRKLPFFLRKIIVSIEIWVWLHINSIVDRVNVVHPNSTQSFDTLFLFSYKICQLDLPFDEEAFRHLRVIAHLSHYHLFTREKSKSLQNLASCGKVRSVTLAADNDFMGNDYFKTHFGWYKERLEVYPFAVHRRFRPKKSWKNREAKVAATGTFHNFLLNGADDGLKDISEFSDTLHPERKIIFDRRVELSESVNCLISEYKIYKNSFVQSWFASQKKYFETDIVDFYNQHKFAFVGEEITGGLPIGVFEAMACGSVVICNPNVLVGFELEAGVHFIPHTEDILASIETTKLTDELVLNSISENAAEFAKNHLNFARVRRYWDEKLVA